MKNRPCIAIIDDDESLLRSLSALMSENHFVPLVMKNREGFFSLCEEKRIDLAIIDLKLSDESGFELMKETRQRFSIPIIMLTGTGGDIDRIMGLETGADDYILKPFNPRELIARVKAVLRRYADSPQDIKRSVKPDVDQLAFGDKRLDIGEKQLYNEEGGVISLTNAEYQILAYFLRYEGRVIPRKKLLSEIGSDLTQIMDRTIDVLILRLRQKIEPVPSRPQHILTRRGQGYIFFR